MALKAALVILLSLYEPVLAQSPSSPKQLKQDAISALQGISTSDRDLQKKISSALDDIRQSLSDKNTNFFLDDSTENFLGGREDFWGDGTGLLVAYVPKEKLLIQADTFIPRPGVPPLPAPSPFTTNLVENVERLKLDVQRVAHIHGGVNCWSEILKAAGR